MAGHGAAGLGLARQGGAGRGWAWLGVARQGATVIKQGEAKCTTEKKMNKAAAVKINRHADVIERDVILSGTTDIMFDRYAGDNDTQLEPWQKLYLEPGDSRVIGLPAVNI